MLDNNGYTAALTGMLSRGSARTVVRVDATFMVADKDSVLAVQVYALLNGKFQGGGFGSVNNACSSLHPNCSVTGTFWFDVDELEAASAGNFVGQPLNIAVVGGPLTGTAAGESYQLTFSAQVVKKK
jgi:hypothetical protein